MKMSLHAIQCVASFTLIALFCFTSGGCRSMKKLPGLDGQCQGGSCGTGDHSSVSVDQTPAEMFATMNYDSIAEDQQNEARRVEEIARIPAGPDSLFAPYK